MQYSSGIDLQHSATQSVFRSILLLGILNLKPNYTIVNSPWWARGAQEASTSAALNMKKSQENELNSRIDYSIQCKETETRTLASSGSRNRDPAAKMIIFHSEGGRTLHDSLLANVLLICSVVMSKAIF
ncbi:hypothetical protein J6590_011110 [Homalodisca vitripennis]|nr:hypothetical protein J6590_011110 [Homalodisca vitripennis]